MGEFVLSSATSEVEYFKHMSCVVIMSVYIYDDVSYVLYCMYVEYVP